MVWFGCLLTLTVLIGALLKTDARTVQVESRVKFYLNYAETQPVLAMRISRIALQRYNIPIRPNPYLSAFGRICTYLSLLLPLC